MLPVQQRINEAVEVVRAAWQAVDSQADRLPEIILTTGSGLGILVESVFPRVFEMSYGDIPHLRASRVVGHAGRLVIGHYGGADGPKVAVLDGRIHGYEGHDPLTQVLPFLIANELCGGARLAIFTNAAGAINESYATGDLMIIKDHLNFTGESLLTFNEAADFGGSNLDMTFAYTARYREMLKKKSYESFRVHEGVYLGVKGAMFETPAEIRAFRHWGADAVGMSTVHEVTAASRLDIDVVGISVITNMAAGIGAHKLTHQEVLENTIHAAGELALLIADLM
ncbi:MAG: purine-nucleoside phosphorylase [Coriobacteriales bacterium]|jgi:purine-nucleoside phosphorylase|nr:purine-nucleoside phosphorylase [Coriobacteriales bacterium]